MRCAAATIPGPGPILRSALTGVCRTPGRAVGLAAVLAFASPAAIAGPWARGEGDVFLSFGITSEETRAALLMGELEPERTLSFYGEYGFGHRFTGGLELDLGEISRMGVVFLRRTLTPGGSPIQLAVDGGIGLRQVEDQDTETRIRIGASAGMGYGAWNGDLGNVALAHHGGWITFDGYALLDAEGAADPILKGDLTMGLNLSERAASILSITIEEWPDADTLVTLRPSVTFDLTERTTIQTGAHAAVEGSGALGLSLSIWQEF